MSQLFSKSRVTAYTDGACSGNPGPGGWGVLLQYQGKEKELFGGEPLTTNNRMEIMAAIAALEALKIPCYVLVLTDSIYLKNGVTRWISGWQRNGWKTSSRKPVKNEDLWRKLLFAQARHTVEWQWVKGHADNPGNERADALSRRGVSMYLTSPSTP